MAWRAVLLSAAAVQGVGGLSDAAHRIVTSHLAPLRPAQPAPRAPVVLARLSRKARRQAETTQGAPRTAGGGFAPAPPEPSETEVGATATAAAAAPPVTDDASEPADLFPVPGGDAAWKQHRVDAPAPTYDALFGAATDLTSQLNADGEPDPAWREAWRQFVWVNRDQLEFRFLYKLTAQSLAAANLGDERRADVLRALRVLLVQEGQRFDAGLFKDVGQAEGRLGTVLAVFVNGGTPSTAQIEAAAAGSGSAKDVFTFWLVVVSALVAWEAKLGVASIEKIARTKIAELSQAPSPLQPKRRTPLRTPPPRRRCATWWRPTRRWWRALGSSTSRHSCACPI